MYKYFIAFFPLLLCCTMSGQTVWTAGSRPSGISVTGQPALIATGLGDAVEFDGRDDGIFIPSVPVAGMDSVTIEVIMNQYSGAAFENRFLHIGIPDGPRILFETRTVPQDSCWYADFFVVMAEGTEKALIKDPTLLHKCDRWYNMTLVCAGGSVKGYVDGVLQGEAPLRYRDVISEGMTSVGVRQNIVSWFKGAIYKIRITSGVLSPEQFLKDHNILNHSPIRPTDR